MPTIKSKRVPGSMDPEVTHARSKLANAHLRGDEEAIRRYRSELALAKLKAHIRQVVKAMPPLTPEQAAELAALLPLRGEPDDPAA